MKKIYAILLILPVVILSLPIFIEAFDLNLEKELQNTLLKSRVSIKRAKDKIKRGEPITNEITQLKTDAENIKSLNLLLEERFRLRDEEVKGLGSKAIERQSIMSEGYRKALNEYLSLIDSIPPEISSQQSVDSSQMIDNLETLLNKILYKKKLPLLGSLPYRNLNYPSKEPNSDSPIKPAYKGGNKTVSSDDLKDTEEAPISQEIATLAESLDWNPVSIYEYVKNSIETEWYWGCMKGAEDTLSQKSGNDCDQATLLIALLRASGFPSRYVRGAIEFFTTDGNPIERVKNFTGIDDPWKIAAFFQKAGIPNKPIIAGGKISNFEIEHIWVESQIPYANYRGAIIDEYGKAWLGLDTSIKVKEYQYNNPLDIFSPELVSGSLLNIGDEYLSTTQTQTPLEYTKSKIEAYLGQKYPGKTYNDLLKTKTLTPEVMNILPASMQFDQKNITHEYTEIPDELKHKVRFMASRHQTGDSIQDSLFDITLDMMKLSNKQITISYEPETVEDQQIIDSYGGLDNTPAYLVRLRPVLKVNGERIVVAKDGLPMGADYNLTIELISPNGIERISSTHIAGNLSVIGIVAQKSRQQTGDSIQDTDKDAEQILYEEVINYIDRWNKAEEELASLMHLAFTRPIPAIATIGGVIDITYLLDMPHGYEWKGVYVDTNLRTVETVDSRQNTVEQLKTFMTLSALQGSILENRLFEDDFGVESISTAKLFEVVGSIQQTGDSIQVVTIDKTNIVSILPTLPFDENILEDITNSTNQNLIVKIPNQEITHEDWTGIGYIKENPETGESGYMLSGMIAGGMTAITPEEWVNQYLAEKLGKPHKDYKTIVITSPKNGTTVTTSPITVTGIVMYPKAKVDVNGVEANVSGNTFTATGIGLSPGINKITATATNEAGVKTSDTVIVTYKIPLKITITFPYDGATLSASPITVEGIVSDPAAIVEVNGIKAVVSADGRFVASGIPLSEGMNQITAKATNKDGESTSHIITITYKPAPVPPMFIAITSPTNGATINRPTITVKGTVTTEAQEVSIKVNGIVADVYGNQFVANNVPLTEGNNLIVANALDGNGATARAEVTVNAATFAPHVTLSANITSGIPPLATYFSVSTEIPNSIVSYEMDFEGDGVIDYAGTSFENVSYTYTTSGIFNPTIRVTDDQGNIYTDTIAITVLNKAEIDALLKGKWEGMKTKLKSGDIEGALKYFIERSKERYRSIFEALKDQFPVILSTFVEFNIVDVFENIAEYEVIANESGVLYSYPGTFIKDYNGIWKFRDF